jgi:hypothetical protein
MLPVGEAVAPKFHTHPVGANCQGDITLVSLNETVPPGIICTDEVAPVAVEKSVYGGVGIGPFLVVTPSGVLSNEGDPIGTLSNRPGVL